MTENEWLQTPEGRIQLPTGEDVPTASSTFAVGDGKRLLVFATRPALSVDNAARPKEDRELDILASFGLTVQGVDALIGMLTKVRDQAVVDQSTGQNQPCPCGSGRKYKHCHGRR